MISRRKKQLYLGVVLLGGIALAVDRLILPAGVTEPAEATASVSQSASGAGDNTGPTSGETFSIPEVPFPRGVMPLSPDAKMRDLFVPLARRSFGDPLNSSADNGRDGSTEDEAAGRLSSAAFVSQHSLQGVMVNPRLKIAIVDADWLRLGEVIDGCTLSDIDGGAARFECFDGEAVLSVVNEVGPQGD